MKVFHRLLRRRATGGLVMVLALFAVPVRAHSLGESYVRLGVQPGSIKAVVELPMREVEEAFGVAEVDKPGPADAAAAAPILQPYIAEHLAIEVDGQPVELIPSGGSGVDSEAGAFLQYFFQAPLAGPPTRVAVRSTLLFSLPSQPRCLVLLESNYRDPGRVVGAAEIPSRGVGVLSPARPSIEMDLASPPGLDGASRFLVEGMHHIWIGYDHMLFLFTLLLPAVLVRDGGAWKPAPTFRAALWRVVRIVTLFTVAHTVTLSLSALEVVRVPSRVVESTIALSIALVAANNLRPVVKEGSAPLILGFGLFHGLGFATVLGELPFRRGDLAAVLLHFNLGVEAGQVVVVAAVFPMLFALSRRPGYVPRILRTGSVLAGGLALFWFVQRAFAG